MADDFTMDLSTLTMTNDAGDVLWLLGILCSIVTTYAIPWLLSALVNIGAVILLVRSLFLLAGRKYQGRKHLFDPEEDPLFCLGHLFPPVMAVTAQVALTIILGNPVIGIHDFLKMLFHINFRVIFGATAIWVAFLSMYLLLRISSAATRRARFAWHMSRYAIAKAALRTSSLEEGTRPEKESSLDKSRSQSDHVPSGW